MRKMLRLLFILLFALTLTASALAHTGGTDSQGGHTDHSTGEYHYHHGYSAHDHYDMDGDGDIDCPYDFKDNTEYHYTESSNQRTTVPPSIASPTREPPKENFMREHKELALSLVILVAIWLVAYIIFIKWPEPDEHFENKKK